MKSLFAYMAGGRLPLLAALILLPAIFITFVSVGFTRKDIIEDDVYRIWAKENSDYYKDSQYAKDVGRKSGSSTLLAMSTSRDGGNILTTERLDEIKNRMEAMETETVEHGGNTFTWKDICASNNIGLGTVYEFPCVRLSPMDMFQEARWYMTEKDRSNWYKEGIIKKVVRPRVTRLGMLSQCAKTTDDPCNELYSFRSPPGGDPRKLFADIGNMEKNNPCSICVEQRYSATIGLVTDAAPSLFGIMALELGKSKATLTDQDKIAKIDEILQKIPAILAKLASDKAEAAIEEFFTYYITRGLYGELGASAYLQGYGQFNASPICNNCMGKLTDRAVNEGGLAKVALTDLNNHADAAFSSIDTAGSPLPIPTGLPSLPAGPRGGSGINLGGTPLEGSAEYFDLANYGNSTWSPKFGAGNVVDLDDAHWTNNVEQDPLYKWFIAGETEMTARCGGSWCTNFSPTEDVTETKQYFAKMWYDLLIDSPMFLNIRQGEDDPYTWTNGEGCPVFNFLGSRPKYNETDTTGLLEIASQELYFIDEGASVGPLDKALMVGGDKPSEEASLANPYTKVTSFQHIYPALVPEGVVERVRNCNRPNGPIEITVDDAKIVLEKFKKSMLDVWSAGWDKKNAGDVQFTGFFDSAGVPGTFTVVLRDITDDSTTLTIISIVIIAAVSMIFLASCNKVESRAGITLVGVFIVVLSFVGALGFAVLVGIKININIAWTLPFIMIGLGVDDMYIVMNAMQNRKGNSDEDFIAAMNEVVVPVTMTSLVNASMFAVMNIVNIGAIYKTAQAALIAVTFLYLSIVFCFPAYCYLDMRRQRSKRCDVLVCIKSNKEYEITSQRDSILFRIYKHLFLSKNILSKVLQLIICLGTIALFVVGIVGISTRKVGVGIQEFFPKTHQANRWAEIRNEDLAGWPIGISWGAVKYTDPDVQLEMMKQFEDIVRSTHVTYSDTKWLWIADFNLWTTKHCKENLAREKTTQLECGADQIFPDDESPCTGTWVENTIGLQEKLFIDVIAGDSCSPNENGICRPASQMFQSDLDAIGAVDTAGKSYCPVFKGWSDNKLKFCVEKWREYTGGGGGLLVEEDTATAFVNDACPGSSGEFLKDDQIKSPIPISSSPTLYATELYTHEDTVDMIKETRKLCDDSDKIHCFMTGIPYDFWEQYLTVDSVLLKLCLVSVAVGFVVANIFLFLLLDPAKSDFGLRRKIAASLSGGMLIALTIILCLIPVIGISLLVGVNLTAFSNMAFVLSISFATEYSVHVVHRFLSAPTFINSASDRVEYTMKFLTQPLTLSFLSSTIGVICLAFTKFDFNERFFFRPLIIVMMVTYVVGSFFLPILLTFLDFDILKVGHKGEMEDSEHFKSESKAGSKFNDDVGPSEHAKE